MSSPATASPIDTGILLEAGTNEAELLVFHVRGKRFGVNVAKVREVLPIEGFTEIPKSDPAVDGLIDIREAVVPLVNLERYLFGDPGDTDSKSQDSLVLLEFNNEQIAFRVQAIERIYRVSWKNMLPSPQLGNEATPVTSILRQEQGLVPLLDFESICANIGLGCSISSIDSVPKEDSLERSHMPIVFADDSRMICEMIRDSLVEAGYTSVKGFSDGQDAWNYIEPLAKHSTTENIHDRLACIITDIEMPRMDGLSLTKKVREHPVLGNVPVIVFSSIATKDNEKKGVQVGASFQVSKPHYDDLVATVGKALQ
ncbi:MAG: chemotaxis protein CheV [Pirellulales bacterium]|nr:chemotaxis protein CheV [Pirellulales bacterium]